MLLVASALVATETSASAASYDGTTYQELLQDPTLHNEHSIVIRFYAAVFARQPDNDGIRFWLDQYDGGEWSTRRIADFFVTSDEFKALYGDNTSNAQFVDAVYPNVLGRQPDANGRSFWIGFLDEGNTRAEMVLLVSNSPEFINANPLPSDGRPIPAPVDATRVFDGLVNYNGVAFPTENDFSKGTNAWWYAGYVNVLRQKFDAPLNATSRTPVAGGYQYVLDTGDVFEFTNPSLDVSGRLAHFDVSRVPLETRSAIVVDEVPDLDLSFFAYQFVSGNGRISVWVRFANESASNQESFATEWVLTDASGNSSLPVVESGLSVIPAGGIRDEIAIFESDAAKGGTVTLDVQFQVNGQTNTRTLTLDFG